MKGSFSMKKIFKVKDRIGVDVFFGSQGDAESFIFMFCDKNQCNPIYTLSVEDDEVLTHDEWRYIENRVCDLSAFKDVYPKKWTDKQEKTLQDLLDKAAKAKYVLDDWTAPVYDEEDEESDHPDYEEWFRDTYCSQ